MLRMILAFYELNQYRFILLDDKIYSFVPLQTC